jgi:hypothetical protein
MSWVVAMFASYVALAVSLACVLFTSTMAVRQDTAQKILDLLNSSANVVTHTTCRGDLRERIEEIGGLPTPPKVTTRDLSSVRGPQETDDETGKISR